MYSKPVFYLIFLSILVTFCRPSNTVDQKVKTYTRGEYFRKLTFYENEKQDSFVRAWYSNYLEAFEEPILYNKQTSDTIYRFLLLPSFSSPIVVRIQKGPSDSVVTIAVKTLTGSGGYNLGRIWLNVEKFLFIDFKDSIPISSQWEILKQKINRIGKEKLPVSQLCDGADGSMLIMEAIENNEYFVLQRWEPGICPDPKNKELTEAYHYTLQMAAFNWQEFKLDTAFNK